MDKKIIKMFPFEELNVILGGIREKTIYSFALVINDETKPDESLWLIRDTLIGNTDSVWSAKHFLKIFAANFGITRRDESLTVINYQRIIRDMKRYFKNIEIDIDSIYENHTDIYEFLDYFNNNPIIKDEEDKVIRMAEKKGSIIEFSILNKDGYYELAHVNTPKDFERTDIMIYTSGTLFDSVITIEEGHIHQYPYPFIALKGRGINKTLFEKGTKLVKTFTFEAEIEDENPEIRKYMISKKYSFSRSYDVMRRVMINKEID